MKKISVIIPVYNVEKYLEDCLESVIKQNYKNLEIILINDGSLDNSLKICEKYKKKDDRIIIINKKNEGVSSARNTGLKIAKGEYISFIDSDDFLLDKNVYSEMICLIEEEKVDLVHCDALYYYSDIKNYPVNNLKSILGILKVMNSEDLFLISLKNNILYAPVCFNLYNKELLDKNKIYFREGIYHEDEEFTPRVLLTAEKVAIYKKEFYGYRQRENSIMTSGNNLKKGKDLIQIAEVLATYIEKIENLELKQKFGERISGFIIFQAFKYKFNDLSDTQIDIVNKYSYSKNMRIRAKLMKIILKLFYYVETQYRKLRKIDKKAI